MARHFDYDVFLSHATANKPRVLKLAEHLRDAGLRVWFDAWVIKPGDDIYLAVEKGLEASRVLVLCLSPEALGSAWVDLERSTALFRDPSNSERRFVPALLAHCQLPDTLKRYKYVDLRQGNDLLHELVTACQLETAVASPKQPRFNSAADLIQQADAQAMVERWTRARKGEPLDGEPHRLDVFVEPRISIRLPQPQAGRGGAEEKWETLPAGVQALLDQHFIPSDRWLVITEDAGGGKTVLSWLLAAELSRCKERFWVVRYEGRFPEDLRKDLTTRLEGKLGSSGTEQTATEVLNELLAQRRVVVIYDALDQDNSSFAVDRIHALRHSIPDDRLKTGLKLIVTSRPYAVNHHHSKLFHLQDWRHCRLELFDEGQQSDYRQQVGQLAESGSPGARLAVEDAYQKVLPDPESVADLLVYPVVQAQIGGIIESQLDSNATSTLRPFYNAGDLYLEVANRLLERAFKSGRYADTPTIRAKLLQLLACYGYLMMLEYRDYRVPQMEIETMHASVRDRCSVGEKDWEQYEEILQDTSVTERLLLKENAKRELSFPSLKMAEFFAGLYLGRYCDERVIQELQPEIGRGEWNNVWRFVAELPET
ncbi:MAG: hypothetical protein RLZZ436_1130, partial [Planctomycetota bacterium]